MHKDHGECQECQVCGIKEAKTVCTFIINEKGERETDCWCVCEDCRVKLEEGVHEFYKEMLPEKGHDNTPPE